MTKATIKDIMEAHNSGDYDEMRDRIASDELSEWMINKVVTEVIVKGESCVVDDECHDRITIKFSDGSSFVIDEGGQAGYMLYSTLPAEVSEKLTPRIDFVNCRGE